MGQTSLYKQNNTDSWRQRMLVTESTFASGMMYTNNPLVEGKVKTLVNYAIRDDGESLAPRGGLLKHAGIVASLPKTASANSMHHAHSMFVSDSTETDTTLCEYALIGDTTAANKFKIKDAILLIRLDDHYIYGAYDASAEDALDINTILNTTVPLTSMHGMDLPEAFRGAKGVFASLEGNTYVLTNNTVSGKNIFASIHAKFNEDLTSVIWHLKAVTPAAITATQAVNYGYNMLADEPYKFETKHTATGGIIINGILPYGNTGTLLLTARPGTEITFRLAYEYPTEDSKERYMMQWELQDLESNSDPIVVQDVRSSAKYFPGSVIEYTCTPTYKNFSVIAKLYRLSDIVTTDADYNASSDALKDMINKNDNLYPDKVLTLASYYLTNDSNSSTVNQAPTKYDLVTATGMCTWQQRIVLWGVPNAKSTLFVSEINRPEYVPFPNNSEIFNADIVCAVPYMNWLLVFTTNALYKLVLNADGLTYAVICVQERLHMEAADFNTVVAVQNMVYFKSGNAYYMLVPRSSSTTGEVQLAPVSIPLGDLLGNFDKEVYDILDTMYAISKKPYSVSHSYSLEDYYTYLSGKTVCNVYKLKLQYLNAAGDIICDRYIDFSMNYNTTSRSWVCTALESTENRISLFRPTLIGQPELCYLVNTTYGVDIYIAKFGETEDGCIDECPLDMELERMYPNYQYLDTGHREHNTDLKKRYREIQFSINCKNHNALKFYTGFYIDDRERTSFYRQQVTQITDKTDVNYGTIYVEPTLDNELDVETLTILDTEWTLDASRFPELTVVKIRQHVSGKGYSGGLKLLSTNAKSYDFLKLSWAYRTMLPR